MQKEVLSYDDNFKRTLVEMLATGELSSIEEAKRVFNVNGSCTIQKWIRKINPQLLPTLKKRKLKDEMTRLKETEPVIYDKVKKYVE